MLETYALDYFDREVALAEWQPFFRLLAAIGLRISEAIAGLGSVRAAFDGSIPARRRIRVPPGSPLRWVLLVTTGRAERP